jgi:hypothetical protein
VNDLLRRLGGVFDRSVEAWAKADVFISAVDRYGEIGNLRPCSERQPDTIVLGAVVEHDDLDIGAVA